MFGAFAKRIAQANKSGFMTDMPLYHGTNQDINEFSLAHGGKASGSKVGGLGVSAALDPQTASEFARQAGNDGANVLKLFHRASKPTQLNLDGTETNDEIYATVAQAWDDGFDAIKFNNYTTPTGETGRSFVLVKDPNQLRSVNAKFDPKKINSADITAGIGALGLGMGAMMSNEASADDLTNKAGQYEKLLDLYRQKGDKQGQLKVLRAMAEFEQSVSQNQPQESVDQPISTQNFDPLNPLGQKRDPLPLSIAHGTINAVNETVDLANSAADWISENIGTVVIGGKDPETRKRKLIEVLGPEEYKKRREIDPAFGYVGDIPNVKAPESIGGQLVSGISQFLTGFVGAGKTKLFSALKPTSKLGQFGKAAAQGAVADFTVFDEHEARLADLIQSNPKLQNPVTEYLQSDPEDSAAEGRFKNAIEGFGLGTLAEGFIRGVKVVKQGLNAKRQAADVAGSPEEINLSDTPLPGEPPRQPGTPPSIEEINITELPKQQQIRQALETGGREAAGYKLQNNRVVKDPVQLRALDEGFDPSTVNSAYRMNPSEKAIGRRILNKAANYLSNRSAGIMDHPAGELGKPVVDRFNVVLNENRRARTLQSKALKELGPQKIDTTNIVDSFDDQLNELGFDRELTKQGIKLRPTNPTLKRNPGNKHLQVINEMLEQKPTGAKLQELKDYLDDQINYDADPMNVNKMDRKVINVMKDVRAQVNQQLRAASPDYASANDILSETIQTMNDFGDVMGRRFDIDKGNVSDYVGKQMRKVASEYGVGDDMISAIGNLDAAAAKYGTTFNDNPVALAQFYSDLEKRFGSFRSNSFQGKIDKSIAQNVGGAAIDAATGNVRGAVVNTAKSGIDLAKSGVNKVKPGTIATPARKASEQRLEADQKAIRAMRALLRN